MGQKAKDRRQSLPLLTYNSSNIVTITASVQLLWEQREQQE